MRPARLLSDDAVIRLDGDGRPWLLNRQRRGWGEFGYGFDDLGSLTATFAVEVSAVPETDQHGQFWRARRAA